MDSPSWSRTSATQYTPHPVAIDLRLSHTRAVMAICPLCSDRPGKRYCPAKETQICAVCCGTKREIEIDCPSSCGYLKASRSYESEKPIVDPELIAKIRKYDNSFVERFHFVLAAINGTVIEERMGSPWLVDKDVIEVYKALASTMRTLSSGIYYESLPDGTVQLSLFRRLKKVFDELMQPDPSGNHPMLKSSEAVDILDFVTFAAQMNSSTRPRTRRYLDWITETFGYPQPQQSSGLIIP